MNAVQSKDFYCTAQKLECEEEFEASNYMARQAKKLLLEKVILSSLNPKLGKALPDRTHVTWELLGIKVGPEYSSLVI